jgi:excinuclease ABC subunit B
MNMHMHIVVFYMPMMNVSFTYSYTFVKLILSGAALIYFRYAGDRARKNRLVKHGYRLPSALDNRPLKSTEFWDQVSQAVFVSATPSRQELELAEQDPVDMIIRPTFVCDPLIHVRPSKSQLGDLLREIRIRAKRNERTLVVCLTKLDAEDLASFLLHHNIKARYIHSGLTTVERADALKALQSGEIDTLVGVNLLREGLDLPQVSLVAILNADSEVCSLFIILYPSIVYAVWSQHTNTV